RGGLEAGARRAEGAVGELLPALDAEAAPVVLDGLVAVLGLALLDDLERAVLLVLLLVVALLALLDAMGAARLLVTRHQVGVGRHLIAPRLLAEVVVFLDRDHALPAVRGHGHRLGALADEAVPDAEDRQADQ